MTLKMFINRFVEPNTLIQLHTRYDKGSLISEGKVELTYSPV